MALTRKFLTALGIEADKVDEIINAHVETVDALKSERDGFKEKAEKYDAVKAELDEAKEKLKDSDKEDSYKVKYDALKEDFDKYKADVETEKSNESKKGAYKALLKEIGISEKRIDSVARLAELDKIKLDKDGKIEGADDLKKSLKAEWADFITTEGTQGADTATPPNNGGGAMSKDDIMKIKDTTERQKAWGEYIKQGGH